MTENRRKGVKRRSHIEIIAEILSLCMKGKAGNVQGNLKLQVTKRLSKAAPRKHA